MTDPSQRRADPFDVRTLSLTYYDGHLVPPHRHPWAQLIYARSGMMRVLAGHDIWLVPPTRAIWIPAGIDHQFSVKGETAFRTVYVSPARALCVFRDLGAMEVPPLLAELILHVAALGMLNPNLPAHDRLAGVLTDLVSQSPAIDLLLPLPRDMRARRLADLFQSNPEDSTPLPLLANKVGASVRTLQRRFISETGMSIDSWRQKSRLIASTAALAAGSSVTNAALDCGYDSPSAFIAAFKRQFSVTPRRFANMR